MKKKNIALLGAGIAVLALGGVAAGLNFHNAKALGVLANYAVAPQDCPEVSASTRRLWFVNNGSNFWSDNCQMGLMVTAGVAGSPVYKSQSITVGTQPYFFFDVPTSSTHVKILRINKAGTECYNEVNELYLDYVPGGSKAGENTDLINYVNEHTEGNWWWDISFGAADNMSAEFFAKVLEGYRTCESSAANGYGAYPFIKASFYDRGCMTDGIKAELATYAISDFEDTSYAGKTSYFLKDKWEAMGTKYSALSPVGAINPMSVSGTVSAVIVTAVSGVAAAGALVFIRRRHVL